MTFSCLTEDEVRYKYRRSDDKEKMIKILCELTCSSEKEMMEFLCENIVKTKRKNNPRRCFLDKELAKKYYDSGMTDSEIAIKTGASKEAIRSWRRRNGFVGNYYKSGEKNAKK